MAARVPSATNAAIELGFVLAAGALGYVHAPLWVVPALAALMIAYWAFNRRAGLAQLLQMGALRLAGAVAVSVALVGLFLAGAYWLGAILPGSTP